jgi:hypothetical protein
MFFTSLDALLKVLALSLLIVMANLFGKQSVEKLEEMKIRINTGQVPGGRL